MRCAVTHGACADGDAFCDSGDTIGGSVVVAVRAGTIARLLKKESDMVVIALGNGVQELRSFSQ